jgi:DNA (cytosine-5)-methyltransferase 1
MIRILELFAGIGAASKALTNLGIEHEIVDAVEIDKYAIKSFNAIHGTNFEPQDITKWDKDIECDLIVHGSPCQDFSIAGKQAGGDKDSGTRSSLMYETLRIVEKLKPKYVIWENVKNLLSAMHRPNFDAYQKAMEELGYENYYQVLNAKNYGVPQNRERVFTVSIRKDYPSYVYNKFREPFDFPQPIPLEKRLKDVLEPVVDEKYYLSDKQTERLRTTTFNQQKARYNTLDAVTPTLCARDYKDPQVVRLGGLYDGKTKHQAGSVYDPDGVSATLSTMQAAMGEGGGNVPLINGVRIRKLTPTECWRLMGFTKEDCDKASQAGVSNSQLYKQAGNSIVVDVLMAIFKELLCK